MQQIEVHRISICFILLLNIHSYSFITNCQTAVVHNNKTKRMSKIYKSQYIFRYNILTVKLQSVIREMRSGRPIAVYCEVYF